MRLHKIQQVKTKNVDPYVPKTPSDIANICLTCPLESCNPTNCKRLKEEKEKLKK